MDKSQLKTNEFGWLVGWLVSIYQVPVSVDGSLYTSLTTGLNDESFAHLLGIKGEVANFPIEK